MHTSTFKPKHRPPIVMIGGGGHARVLLEAAFLVGYRCEFVLDDSPDSEIIGRLGLQFGGGLDHLADFDSSVYQAINAVGSANLPQARQRVHEVATCAGFSFATLVHPQSIISPTAVLGAGVQVLPGAVVSSAAVLHVDVLINTRATIDHDSEVGAHTHIAPGAVVCGGVRVGSGCHVGCGATIIQGVVIGDHSLVAAGAVVTRDVAAGSRVAGVPARPM